MPRNNERTTPLQGMEDLRQRISGWLRVPGAARYADSSTRSIRRWMKAGLRYSRLPSGTILISKEAIDQFLLRHEVTEDHVDEVVSEIFKGL